MEHKEIILNKISVARRIELQQVYFAIPGKVTLTNFCYSPFPRLIMITAGTKHVVVQQQSGLTELKLKTGDILYCLPCTWEKQDWHGHYEMLCIVPRKDYLRVSLYQQESLVSSISPEPFFVHTGLPYHETLRNTVNALNSATIINDKSIIHNLAKALLGMAEIECQRSVQDICGRPKSLFNQIRNWTSNSFQENINRKLAATVFNISPGYLSQLFKTYHGNTFQDYLSQCRMDYARELLENTDFTVYQVADQSGFMNYVHFVRRFRELNGIPPGKYRDTIQAK